MNKLAFYGHKMFFDNTTYYDWLSIINGCYRNVEFAKTPYNSKLVDEEDKEIISGIFISHNIKKEEDFPDFLYYDLLLITQQKKLYFNLKKEKDLFEERVEDFVFLSILNDWKDLYDSVDHSHSHRSHKGYSLALYQDKKYYIKYQLSLKTNKEVDESYFSRYLNSNILEKDTNYYPKVDENGYESSVEHHSEEEYKDESSIIPDNPSKYDIVNSFEIAYELFKRGKSSNLVLSKIRNTSSDNYIELYRKYKPFLLFTCNEVYSPQLIKENSLFFIFLKKHHIAGVMWFSFCEN